jgi:hypothetical protein
MPVRKIAKTVRAAFKDAGAARHAATDPAFRRELQKDRRETLRRFRTVEHALEDRAKIEKAKAAKAKKK